MDTYELLIGFYRKYAVKEGERIDQSDVMMRLLGRVVEQPIWMRNSLLLIQRFFSPLLREVSTSRVIDWLLSAGFQLKTPELLETSKMQGSGRQAFLLAATLIGVAEDVALAQPVSCLLIFY